MASTSTTADRDKMVLDLLEQRDCKKKQLREDFKTLKKNVKENPYLQVVIQEYEKYFEVEKQQLKALKTLLAYVKKEVDADGATDATEDTKYIQRHIKHLEHAQ
jgi:hypothetical protein